MKKKILFATSLALLTASYVGYYQEYGHSETYTHVFIKKRPTLQIKFDHIFANYKEHKAVSELSADERQRVINYCKYRLGIETKLETESELERCKAY